MKLQRIEQYLKINKAVPQQETTLFYTKACDSHLHFDEHYLKGYHMKEYPFTHTSPFSQPQVFTKQSSARSRLAFWLFTYRSFM